MARPAPGRALAIHRRLVPATDRAEDGACAGCAAPGPALQAALGGEIQILFDNLYPSLPQVQDGKLNALAVTTPERGASTEIPTMRESAPELAKFDVCVVGSACSSEEFATIVDALNLQIKAMLERDEIQEEHRRDGRTRGLRHPAAVFRFWSSQTAKFAGIIEREGLQMEVK